MNLKDTMGLGDSPGEVLAEVFSGIYDNLVNRMEITEDGAHVIIPSEHHDWVVTIRKVPHVTVESSQSIEA